MSHATRRPYWARLGIVGAAVALSLSLATAALADDGPVPVGKQGSFFVGGETRALGPNNDITVNQMYVQYQIPPTARRHVPS